MPGADIVIELPAVFAAANAEIFATGAMKIVKSLGYVDTLCFGVESGDAETYKKAAAAMLNETKEFKQILKRELETGSFPLRGEIQRRKGTQFTRTRRKPRILPQQHPRPRIRESGNQTRYGHRTRPVSSGKHP